MDLKRDRRTFLVYDALIHGCVDSVHREVDDGCSYFGARLYLSAGKTFEESGKPSPYDAVVAVLRRAAAETLAENTRIVRDARWLLEQYEEEYSDARGVKYKGSKKVTS